MITDVQSSQRVLIIDDDADRVSWLTSLLGAIDYQPEVIQSKDSESLDDDSPSPLLAIIGESQVELRQCVESVICLTGLPVVLVGDGEMPKLDLPKAAQPNLLGWLSYPVRLLDLMRLLQQARTFAAQGKCSDGPLTRTLVGISPCMQRLRQAIERVAATNATVLITGETGTGKEVVARNVHYASPRRDKPFVAVNCGAIPADLLESELFGHEKGAFTGAVTARKGRFELAEGGTLFLDEIGDMPHMMQVKLLRVLQEGLFERVGSERSIKADVRIIAATHRNLEERISEGLFREDLYYRLQVFPLETPALRERIEDLPLLIDELLARLQREHNAMVGLMPETLDLLMSYHWPGNVRELSNFLERMTILHPYQKLEAHHLPHKILDYLGVEPEIPAEPEDALLTGEAGDTADTVSATGEDDTLNMELPADGLDLREHLAMMEVNLIQQALARTSGVVAHAARLLGVRRTTLVEKLRKYDVAVSELDESFI